MKKQCLLFSFMCELILVLFNMGNEDPSSKKYFRAISNKEMASKMVKMAKFGHFEYVVEYPIWVSIKRYWTGKLALASQNWIYCIRLKENVNKNSFWTFSTKRIQ